MLLWVYGLFKCDGRQGSVLISVADALITIPLMSTFPFVEVKLTLWFIIVYNIIAGDIFL